MGEPEPPVSVIIPCRRIDVYAKECIAHCKRLDYRNCEIIILPDDESKELDGVKVVQTGPITPGAKRNIGMANSNSEICAFIDLLLVEQERSIFQVGDELRQNNGSPKPLDSVEGSSDKTFKDISVSLYNEWIGATYNSYP